MSLLAGKKILLGISGSIAAYKMPILVRLLVRAGAEVRVVMSPAATQFVSPLALATVARHEVYAALAADAEWHNHIELALWADLFVLAPASANTMAKMAQGLCDNMLLACYLAARCPVWLAPAMDVDMWAHEATQENVARLGRRRNHRVLPVGEGELASGLVGKGRMLEVEEIFAEIAAFFEPKAASALAGKRILLTSGATVEPIDPVRYISNHSTGKQGAALALALAERGAWVDFVRAGNTALPQHANIRVHAVGSARELYEQAKSLFESADAAIFAAAVADYTPEEVALQKIKKNSEVFELRLTKTIDTAATLSKQKRPNQITVGFALETQNALENGKGKLQRKNLDLLVLNTLEDAGAGFGHDTNKISILSQTAEPEELPLMSKKESAEAIVARLEQLFGKK